MDRYRSDLFVRSWSPIILVLHGDHRLGNIGSGRSKDNGARRCSWRPSAINSAATVDILPSTSFARDKVPRHSRRNATTARPWSTIHPCCDVPPTTAATVTSILITSSIERRTTETLACRVRVSSTVLVFRTSRSAWDVGWNALLSLAINGNNFLAASSSSSCLTYDVRVFRSSAEADARRSELLHSRKIPPGKRDGPGGWFGPRGLAEAPSVDDGSGGSRQLAAQEGTVLLRWRHERIARAMSDFVRSPVRRRRGADRILVPGSNLPSFLPSCLPSCLPFVSALCTLRGTSGSCLLRPPADGSRGLDSPPSSPVAPSESLPLLSRPGYASQLAS